MIKSKKTLKRHLICIYCNEKIKDRKLIDQIGYGMEEEGIPFKVYFKEENSAHNLAYKAAQHSKLGIGIGVDSDKKVVLQKEKLSKQNPIFDKKIRDFYQAKLMGINAARLEKKIPFKDLDLKGG
ncbi:MAG: glycerol dehydratase reactivase beta/small subunit family protein [Halanaerobium sp.]